MPSNIGHYTRQEFSVLPEFGVNAGYLLTRNLEMHVGFDLLYWTNVARPGLQINSDISTGQIPSSPAFGTNTGTSPTFQFEHSDYWAKGLTLGFTWRF